MAYEKLASTTRAESSAAGGGTRLNAEMNPSQVREFAQLQLGGESANLLRVAVEQLNLSARAFHRVLKLARTIADLAGSESIEQQHLAESIQYRERME